MHRPPTITKGAVMRYYCSIRRLRFQGGIYMRRANGTGSIVKLSGNRRNPYAVRIPARDKYGRIRQRYLSYHRTSPEAQAALDAYNAGRAAYAVPEPDALSVTLQEVYDLWSARDTSGRARPLYGAGRHPGSVCLS